MWNVIPDPAWYIVYPLALLCVGGIIWLVDWVRGKTTHEPPHRNDYEKMIDKYGDTEETRIRFVNGERADD